MWLTIALLAVVWCVGVAFTWALVSVGDCDDDVYE
jgi:hypothetical protein